MRTEALTFIAVGIFTTSLGIVYWFTSYEPAGTVLLLATAGFGLIPGAFLLVRSARMRPRPEDRDDAVLADGAGPIGSFPGSSVWPFVLASGAALAGLGLVFGIWASLPGVMILAVAFVGATLESGGVTAGSGPHDDDRRPSEPGA